MSACGFHVASRSSGSPCKKIAIPVFENRTYKFGVEENITNAVISEFLSRYKVEVVSMNSADAILYGSVVGYSEINPVSFDINENVMYYRLILTVDVVVKDVNKGTQLLSLKGLAVNVDYKVTNDVGMIESSEHNALIRAAQEMGEKITLHVFDWM
jgi:hypothetical protein